MSIDIAKLKELMDSNTSGQQVVVVNEFNQIIARLPTLLARLEAAEKVCELVQSHDCRNYRQSARYECHLCDAIDAYRDAKEGA